MNSKDKARIQAQLAQARSIAKDMPEGSLGRISMDAEIRMLERAYNNYHEQFNENLTITLNNYYTESQTPQDIELQLSDRLNTIAATLKANSVKTEKALVMSFLQSLGYNTSDPNEVAEEYIINTKKVDYAIKHDNQPIMIIECKSLETKLSTAHAKQLMSYLSDLPSVRLAILTNGQIYQLYTNSQDDNHMDLRPFVDLDLLNINEHALTTLLPKLIKGQFNPDEVIATAKKLREINAIKDIFIQQLQEPDNDFIKYFASKIHTGPVTQKVREHYGPLIQSALQQYIQPRSYETFEQEKIEDVGETADKSIVYIKTKQMMETDMFETVSSMAYQAIDIARILPNIYTTTTTLADQIIVEQMAIETVDDIDNFTNDIKENISSYIRFMSSEDTTNED